MRRITRVLIIAMAMLLSACAAAASAAASFSAHGSAKQVYVTGLAPHASMTLLNSHGRGLATKRADAQGGLLFRNVKPGRGYHVRLGRHGASSTALTVFSNRPAPPSRSTYNQTVPSSGYGYMTMRDGIKLAYSVHPPSDVSKAAGLPVGVSSPAADATTQTPTLIEYSGYGYADPAGPQNGISIIANLMGFTVVDVNMRGTGCSAGAYDFFEPLQSLDGYDIVETVAHQPWVLNHKVGMMGISYGGISQLFTGQTNPPSLAAIAPLSVIDQTQTTLYPGGVLNTGFAVAWALERVHDAKPASPTGGQSWAYKKITQGHDGTCKANQALHGEAVNLLAKIRANSHYRASVADPLSPLSFVHKIKAPVFMVCQFTDEQTGGHCPDLAEQFTGSKHKWFTFTNGDHIDSLDPATFNRWFDFMELYVAKRAPITFSAAMQGGAPVIYDAAMGITGVTLPPDPIQAQPTYSGALAAFNQLKSVRILFDNGAGGSKPYYPYPAFEHSWSSFPIPGTQAHYWYFSRGGALAATPPRHKTINTFTWNAYARRMNDFSGATDGGDLWSANPTYHWMSPPPGSGVSYLTSPLKNNSSVVGAGAVHVWVRSSTPNVDLQATISEVRPDGKETFVQNGWVRGNERKLDPRKSTLLEPVLSLRAADVAPLSSTRFDEVTIPLYYEGHVYRTRSRIRVTITAPNGDQPIWSFGQTSPKGHAKVGIAFARHMPSSLILPVVHGMGVPTGLPPCPGLRGEPCRTYHPLVNR